MSRSAIKPHVLHVDDQPGWRGGEQQMLYLARGLQRRQVPTAAVLQRGSAPARMVGQEGIHAYQRFAYGNTDLAGGFGLLPALVGAFGFAEILQVTRGAAPRQHRR